ncbi:MAG: hypothetical protein ACRCSU_04905 [Paracoccaceae bacterium]
MSFFPPGFDPRADIVRVLDLVNINTPDGDFGFLLGRDGKFTDVNSKVWWGSSLIDVPDLELSINGAAPAGSLTLSWFEDPTQRHDPDEPGLIEQVMALGADYIRGRELSFYVQPMTDDSQLWAPTIAPIPVARMQMQSISFQLMGPSQRSLALTWEGAFRGRNTARGLYYTTTDHARLTGSANPSLTFAPMDGRQPEKLY